MIDIRGEVLMTKLEFLNNTRGKGEHGNPHVTPLCLAGFRRRLGAKTKPTLRLTCNKSGPSQNFKVNRFLTFCVQHYYCTYKKFNVLCINAIVYLWYY